jgi:tyrosyl-tRNA synthetase
MNILDELQWRGLFADCTDVTDLTKRLAASPITLYCGFDPTADSLHVGHLVPLLALRRFQNYGHHPIAVAGGATGSIGDPSGKSAERSLLTKDQIQANVEAVRPQLAKFLDFERAGNPARLVDNADWTAQLSYLDFLRDIGKHFSVNQMVAKESVRARMEDREVGISYTEFSYMLLQAFDYMVLARDLNCELQIGGSDQWGNITAGMDLIRKKLQRSAFGLTLPLITKADGTKFGKTEGGSVWLDANRTSKDDFYQFWIRTDDKDVIRYLKFFTFLSREEITELERQHEAEPQARKAHKALAKAATDLIHPPSVGAEASPSASDVAQKVADLLFGKLFTSYTESDFQFLAANSASLEIPKGSFDQGVPLVDLLVHSALSSSKGQARKEIEGGGIYLGSVHTGSKENVRVKNAHLVIQSSSLIDGKYLLVRKGKKNYVVVKVK